MRAARFTAVLAGLALLSSPWWAGDAGGRWQSTTDRFGNAATATYTGGLLAAVASADGRQESFAYHPDGKLATIAEIGVDGVTSAAWSYGWSGLDLARTERPDGTASGQTAGAPTSAPETRPPTGEPP